LKAISGLLHTSRRVTKGSVELDGDARRLLPYDVVKRASAQGLKAPAIFENLRSKKT